MAFLNYTHGLIGQTLDKSFRRSNKTIVARVELATATIIHQIFRLMKYQISYTHTLGECSLMCQPCEVASILRNIALLAMDGHHFANVTISKA